MNFLNKNIDLSKISLSLNKKYINASPFPHVVIDDFFDSNFLNEILLEFPNLLNHKVANFNNPLEKKLGGLGSSLFGEKTSIFINFLNSEYFLNFLQKLTGIKEILLNDPYFLGGGLHEIKNGGFLKIHADFNKHTMTNLDRRVNVLVYLNKNWSKSFGGNLELWDKKMKHCIKSIPPVFNRMVIFNTTDYAFHGHPDKLKCPENISRKSLALYYYSNGRPKSEINTNLSKHSTIFKARPNNNDKTDFNKYFETKKRKSFFSFIYKFKNLKK